MILLGAIAVANSGSLQNFYKLGSLGEHRVNLLIDLHITTIGKELINAKRRTMVALPANFNYLAKELQWSQHWVMLVRRGVREQQVMITL